MWNEVKKWIQSGGAIDEDDDDLYQDLIGPETVPRMDGKIQLESKENMKDRGLPSPNRADALALSFAMPVTKKPRTALEAAYKNGGYNQSTRDYDPLSNI
jgi:hypothetical protein